MRTLSRELRNSKAMALDPQSAFNRWVDEYAFLNNMTADEVMQLAIFKEEGMEYTGGSEDVEV